MTTNYVPYVYEKTGKGDTTYDIYSRLLKDRIILLSGEIDDDKASVVVAQLLFLEAQDPDKDIYLYINSPGGVVTSGLSIFDTMNYIRPDVSTICIGQAASMGAFLLCSGAKGKRFSLPNSRIMIHQPLGGARGQATEIEIQFNEINRLKKLLNSVMAKNTGQKLSKIEEDTDRDFFMRATEAVEYGLIDSVVERKN